MSTIQVNAIQSSTGTQEVTQTTIFSGTAKAWAKVNNTPAIDVDYNVSSITDDGTGLITLNFSSSFASANYAIASDTNSLDSFGSYTAEATGSYQCRTYDVSAAAATDREFASVVCGDLA